MSAPPTPHPGMKDLLELTNRSSSKFPFSTLASRLSSSFSASTIVRRLYSFSFCFFSRMQEMLSQLMSTRWIFLYCVRAALTTPMSQFYFGCPYEGC